MKNLMIFDWGILNMNSMLVAVRDLLQRHYRSYFEELREIAYDSANGEYPCHLKNRMYNFDRMAGDVYGLAQEMMPCTPDALYVSDRVYFIEFKNGKLDTADKKRNLRLKFAEGPYVVLPKLCRMAGIVVDKGRFSEMPKVAVVIYNNLKNPSETLQMRYSSRFQLDEYNYTLFEEVYAFSFSQFERLVRDGRQPFRFLSETLKP